MKLRFLKGYLIYRTKRKTTGSSAQWCKRQLQPWFRISFSAVSVLTLPIVDAKYPSHNSVLILNCCLILKYFMVK